MYEEIHENIDVIAWFHDRKLEPLRFRWKGRAYKVTSLNGVWKLGYGRTEIHHFSVSVSDVKCFKITFDVGDFGWKLERLFLET